MDGNDEDGTNKFQEMAIIMFADSDRYSVIFYDVKNRTLLGIESYTKTTTPAYYVMCGYKKSSWPRQVYKPHAAVTFVQSSDTEKNTTTLWNDGI